MQITDHKNKIIIDRRQNKRHKSRQLWKEESMEQMVNEINELIEQSKQKAKVLTEALTSKEAKAFIEEEYQGSIIPSF